MVFSNRFLRNICFLSWCLDELAEIVKQKKERGHKIFPIFYEVDPSDLKYQKGKVREAFAKHEKRYNEDKIGRWITALTEVVSISGWDSKDRPEAEFIKFIVEDIYKVVPPKLFFHSKDFRPSDSSNITFNQIINALNDNGVNMIGLYGMPGVGKTTLAKEVRKHALDQKLFDKVLMVTMSQTPNFNKIRDSIAGSLRIKLGEGTEEEKTGELMQRLKAKKKILIIIDDVWKEFELGTIGIPSGVEHKGCKILLTLRLQQVCDKMDCQEKFQLGVLSEAEAWALFKDKAGLKDESSELNEVAKEVASECKGLPLAIVTIGKALKGEILDEWTTVNDRLKESRHLDNEDVCDDLYNSLQLSYEYLKVDNIRSCFLLCSLFPEDRYIAFEELIMLGIGHGLFSNVKFFQKLRKEICVALEKLLKSSLLLEYINNDDDDVLEMSIGIRNERYARMHDVLRDFAHWKTLREKNTFMVKQGLTEWPSESFECCAAISFWDSHIEFFPENLVFPKLITFFFEGRYLVKIPSAFIGRMKALRVLRLQNVVFSMEVLKFVANLRTLWFRNCKLENISSLRNMENLEILALNDTNIFELPEELETLCALKSLSFCFPGKQKGNFPPTLLSRLTSLQELHVRCRNNVNLSELNSLTGLTTLSLSVFTNGQRIPENFVFSKLQRYFIAINEDLGFMEGLTFRTLRIADFSSSLSAFKELFFNVEKLSLKRVSNERLMDTSTTGDKWQSTAFSNLVKLYIKEMHYLKELCHGPPPFGFLQKLEVVVIKYCEKLKVVFPVDRHLAKEEISVSNLTKLTLWSLPELECIWGLQSTHSLRSLTVASILQCNKLKLIFSTCFAQSLLNLQQLHISKCDGLEQVFDFDPQEMAELEVHPLSNLTSLDLIQLRELKWIWKGPTHLVSLKSLKTMTIGVCGKLGYLFTISFAQTLVHFEKLEIYRCDSLEHIIKEEAESENSLCWPKLIALQVTRCESLKYVFPMTLAQGLPKLKTLVISYCPQLKHVFNLTNLGKGGHLRQDIVLQKLQILKLECLENLCKFSENIVMSLSLKEFKVCGCPQLTLTGQVGMAFEVCLKDVSLYYSKELLCNAKNVSKEEVRYHKNLAGERLNELTSLTLEFDEELECLKMGANHKNQELTILTLKGGKELECLIDTTKEGHVSTAALSNLVELAIQNISSLKRMCNGPFPKGFLQKLENQAPLLSNLTSLELKYLPELKWLWKGPGHYVSLQSLKVAEISGCNKLRYLFSPSLAQSLVMLEQLKILYCDALAHILTTELETDDNIESEGHHLHPPLFPKLTTLYIRNCPELKYVFQIPMAQVLPELISVSIIDSSQLKQVFNVAKEKSGVDEAIVLPRLQHLQLENLINLSCFSSENYPIVSPSLESLTLWNCPALSNFTLQHQFNKQSQLKELRLDACETISWEQIFQIQSGHFLSRIEVINLIGIIHEFGPMQVASLQFLRELEVSKLNSMKSLFPSMLARNLPQLKFLRISRCEELEEIIRMDQTSIASSSESHPQHVSFPELKLLEISKLPSLKSFGPMGYHFQFGSLIHLDVGECPNLITSFSKDLKHIVHAITEAPRQVEYIAAEDFTTMEERVRNHIFWDRYHHPNTLPWYRNEVETEDPMSPNIEGEAEDPMTPSYSSKKKKNDTQ